MFENQINPSQNTHLLGSRLTLNSHAQLYNAALHQFRVALFKGKIARLRQGVLGRRQYLFDLNDLKSQLSLRGSCYAGIRVVHIDAIVGSEGRTVDFDTGFHPMSESGRERWVNMAIVYLTRLPLPPVQLVQIGEAYFVRDGHHRISVARAFGQAAMDAEVIMWKASPPFPWQEPVERRSSYPLRGREIRWRMSLRTLHQLLPPRNGWNQIPYIMKRSSYHGAQKTGEAGNF